MRALPYAGLMLLVSTAAFGHHVHSLTFRQKVGNHCIINIFGTPAADTLGSATNTCHEFVLGNGGDDTLIGGTVSDTLNGGPGTDTLTGNGGHDTYAYSHTTDSAVAAPDEITDFDLAHDKIDLSGACSEAGVTCSFIGNNFFTDTPGEVAFSVIDYWKCDPVTLQCGDVYVTIVSVDFDGDGASDMDINLDGQLNSLSATNFVL